MGAAPRRKPWFLCIAGCSPRLGLAQVSYSTTPQLPCLCINGLSGPGLHDAPAFPCLFFDGPLATTQPLAFPCAGVIQHEARLLHRCGTSQG